MRERIDQAAHVTGFASDASAPIARAHCNWPANFCAQSCVKSMKDSLNDTLKLAIRDEVEKRVEDRLKTYWKFGVFIVGLIAAFITAFSLAIWKVQVHEVNTQIAKALA